MLRTCQMPNATAPTASAAAVAFAVRRVTSRSDGDVLRVREWVGLRVDGHASLRRSRRVRGRPAARPAPR